MEGWEAGMEGAEVAEGWKAEVARGRREWGTEVFGRETGVGDRGGWGGRGAGDTNGKGTEGGSKRNGSLSSSRKHQSSACHSSQGQVTSVWHGKPEPLFSAPLSPLRSY